MTYFRLQQPIAILSTSGCCCEVRMQEYWINGFGGLLLMVADHLFSLFEEVQQLYVMVVMSYKLFCRPHISRRTIDFLQEEDVNVLPWSSCSANFSPFEPPSIDFHS